MKRFRHKPTPPVPSKEGTPVLCTGCRAFMFPSLGGVPEGRGGLKWSIVRPRLNVAPAVSSGFRARRRLPKERTPSYSLSLWERGGLPCTVPALVQGVRGLPLLFSLLTFAAMPALAIEPGDDHGDTASTATMIAVGTNAMSGSINYDQDADWFAFRALPGFEHVLQINTGTVWDCTMHLLAPDGAIELATTGTVSGDVLTTWSNQSVAGTYFLQLSGYVEFTTGTYNFAVSAPAFIDTDSDGLDDPWEIEHLGSLTNTPDGDVDGDGQTNLDEFYLRTDPSNAVSALAVATIEPGEPDVRVAWDAGQYGTYVIYSATNLGAEAVWREEATVFVTEPSGLVEYFSGSDTGGVSRFYRVDFSY